MKKILIVTGVFPPEQVTSALMNYDLAVELSKNYEVTVLRPYPTRPIGMMFTDANIGNVPFKTILINSYTNPASQLFGRFRESNDFGLKCSIYIKENHKDIDFIYDNPWQLFGVGHVAKTAKKYGIPYMIAIQDIYPECLFTHKKFPIFLQFVVSKLLLMIDKYNQKNAACIRTISDEMRDYLSSTRGIPFDRYIVVNNWQNDQDFMNNFPNREADGKIVFEYVGSINAHANVELIIKAFHEANIPNSVLKIYGGGNHKDQCVQLANNLGNSNIIFVIISRDKVAFVQSQADVLLLALPSGNGNLCLPSKMTSYMMSGKPIIASVDYDSATTRYLREADCGIAAEPDNVQQLAKSMAKFANLSVQELQEKGQKGRQFALETLSRKTNLIIVCEKIKAIIN